LPRDKVHESVIKKLQEITPSRNIEKFFDAIFKEERNTEKLDMKNANKTKEKELAKLKEERDKIEIILNNITDPKLCKKKEEHRAEINQNIEDVEYSMRDITFEKSEFQRYLNDAKTILFNPTAMWKF
jgi:predicted  nucleic acid-binding Zn-ribbon protein